MCLSIAIYHNHKRKNYRVFLLSFQFFIQTNLLVQAANHATHKRKGVARWVAFESQTNEFKDFNKQYA
ncbi:hypothetical protein OI67_02030 [Helicobacter pylori]|nr:hypothetical protein OI67_02030 [Helicobacter pylori]